MFYFELRNIISISCVAWYHGSRSSIELIFWRLVSEYLKEAKNMIPIWKENDDIEDQIRKLVDNLTENEIYKRM